MTHLPSEICFLLLQETGRSLKTIKPDISQGNVLGRTQPETVSRFHGNQHSSRKRLDGQGCRTTRWGHKLTSGTQRPGPALSSTPYSKGESQPGDFHCRMSWGLLIAQQTNAQGTDQAPQTVDVQLLTRIYSRCFKQKQIRT